MIPKAEMDITTWCQHRKSTPASIDKSPSCGFSSFKFLGPEETCRICAFKILCLDN